MILVFAFSLPLAAQSGIKSAAQKKLNKPAAVANAAAAKSIDQKIVGVWGVDARGGYDFRSDGSFIMEGSVNYRFDAANGLWHYWMPNVPAGKVEAEYKISADGKTMSINLKKGNPFTTLKKIK
ncbi:MAG: hypothetical protein ACM34K_20100 [Bacillota bacterium]